MSLGVDQTADTGICDTGTLQGGHLRSYTLPRLQLPTYLAIAGGRIPVE